MISAIHAVKMVDINYDDFLFVRIEESKHIFKSAFHGLQNKMYVVC